MISVLVLVRSSSDLVFNFHFKSWQMLEFVAARIIPEVLHSIHPLSLIHRLNCFESTAIFDFHYDP